MKALVLSAGLGERLHPLTNDIPKPLVEIGGRPLIHYPLLLLRYSGICEVAVNVHHLAGQIEARLGRGEALGLEITYSPEPALLGTGGPLVALRDYFGDEPFVILNCDTIMDLDLRMMIELHQERRALATLAVRKTATPEAYSAIEIDSDNRIRRMRLLTDRASGTFEEYSTPLASESAATLKPLMYCGTMVCDPGVLTNMPEAPPFSLITDLLAPLVAQGLPIFGHEQPGYFRTVDDLEAYDKLRAEFAVKPPALPYILGQ